MRQRSRPSTPGTISSIELNTMALVLEGRHGALAAPVAEFFASSHRHGNDHERGAAWARVAEIVREREMQRQSDRTVSH